MDKGIGLSGIEAGERLKQYGPNLILETSLLSNWKELLKILLNPMGLMLMTLAFLYALLGDKTNAIVLVVALIPVTAVDIIMEFRTKKTLQALKSSINLKARVLRDGRIQEIHTKNIVPGDVLLFEEGQSLPADGKIIEAQELAVNEAALTGESVPVEKSIESSFFAGTNIISGRGMGIVEQTGKNTNFGHIAKLIEETKTEKSPLQKKIGKLIKLTLIITLLLAIILFFLEYARNGQIIENLIIALAFGMSTVPEEFPVVFTLYLSLGAWRLSKHGVLIKSLPSVEALGSVDVICTDKTGTLTEGKFQLETLLSMSEAISPEELWTYALMACEEKPVDAMETAIFEKGQEFTSLLNGWFLKWDYPFEKLGKHMSHVWQHHQTTQNIIVMKGAVEGILEHCEIDPSAKARLKTQVDLFAGLGKRLLGLAYRRGTLNGERGHDEVGLTFAGLFIFNDPIRGSAKEAILQCQSAGIKIKMLTGDHPLTAHAVADETGIIHSHDHLFTGDQLSKMSKEERWKAYLSGAIFSRVLPEQKYEMVMALKESGAVVAMTGDGVNDAPALKLADVSISMGANATDVARSAAQMILLKNDFLGIVEAVFEGRRIFSNLKRSFSYLLSFHVPVILLALLPPALGWGTLLLPIHIILLQLIVHPVSAYAFENMAVGNLKNDPSLMSRRNVMEALLPGFLLSAGSLGLFYFFLENAGLYYSRTLALMTVLFGNVLLVLLVSWPLKSRRIVFTAAALLLLIVLINFVPALGLALSLNGLMPKDLFMAALIAMLAILPAFLLRFFQPLQS